MSAWSYTAPLFTEEKEAAERNALTEEERVTIENRIYGSSDAVVEETADLISASLSQFTEHLESIPVAEKLYYIEALERCPLVVQQESNALRFLRSVDFDAALASKRLVAYWEKRVEVFGSDRAFLPMTLDGAMKEDIQCFEEFGDANFLLPNDEVGRAVYFSDKGRSTTERLSKDQQLRMVWYYFHVAIEDEIVQKLGFVLVVNCRISKPNHFHRAYVRAKFQHLRDILPVKVQAIHDCNAPEFVVQWVYPALKFLMGREMRLLLNLHPPNNLPDCLTAYGLKVENLPTCLHGKYRHDPQKWLESRRKLEQGRQAS